VLTLAFDTATRWGRFALAEEGRVLAAQPHNVSGSYADALMPVVGQVCRTAGRRLDDVAAVAVTRGPGSFTGVRIAVATAKALAYALGADLFAAPTTAAMAAALLARDAGRELAVPVLDARRGELFAALYRRRDSWVEAVVPPAPRTSDAWWDELGRALADVEAPVYGGDGVALLLSPAGRLRDGLDRLGSPRRRPWSTAHPDTAAVLAAAVSRGETALPAVAPFALVPLYLRGSDAEVARRVDLTPRDPSAAVDTHTAQTGRRRGDEPPDPPGDGA
jgi:tRNA threonylcarbamoyladenosine biosynthesis protein TsaB